MKISTTKTIRPTPFGYEGETVRMEEDEKGQKRTFPINTFVGVGISPHAYEGLPEGTPLPVTVVLKTETR